MSTHAIEPNGKNRHILGRREFLGASLAALAAARGVRVRAAETLGPLGVQLYTLRTEMARDVETVLARVAEIGYREVEFAGYFGYSPKEIRAMLDRHGLVAPSAHLALGDLEHDPEAIYDAARIIGHQFLTCPWIPAERRQTLAGWSDVAREFNRLGQAAHDAGFRFAFHNHDYEFVPVGEVIPYDVLLSETDPKLVSFEMDLYWIIKGGADPVRYFGKHPGRFPMLHVKDMAGTPDRTFADVGRGTIDFKRIFRHADEAGVEHYFVENDAPAGSPFDSVRVSYAYLRHLEF